MPNSRYRAQGFFCGKAYGSGPNNISVFHCCTLSTPGHDIKKVEHKRMKIGLKDSVLVLWRKVDSVRWHPEDCTQDGTALRTGQ